SPPRGLADRTRPFTGRWRRAALRVYGWLQPRLPIQMAYVFVFLGRRAPGDAPSLVWPFRDAVIPGGWHAPEETSRWTMRSASVWIRLGTRLEANLLNDEPEGGPLEVAISADGTPLGTATVPPHEWTDIVLDVPEALRGSVARLTIAPARTWSPFDHGSRGDTRELGVSVRRIASA
ncbi:MAG: hypothetical protein M3R54_04365, partial [Chloroflexota bacterium]|nr:hypothetical protein [Chloroflexota bacterium]